MTAIVTPLVLREAIAEALWADVRAQDLAEVCVYLGLEPQGEYENPFDSKRGYVRGRLLTKSMDELAELARKVVAQFGDEDLAKVLEKLGAHGVAGDLKNLIFAADGPKPRIVLRDAINNVIEIVENAEHCLVYDRPLAEHRLTWGELVDWWMERCRSTVTPQDAARTLYTRLSRSLANEAPSGRRTQSATPTFDTVATRTDPAPTRKTEQSSNPDPIPLLLVGTIKVLM